MDSTLIKVEVIDELARVHGVGSEVAAITERAMRGEIDFQVELPATRRIAEGIVGECVRRCCRSSAAYRRRAHADLCPEALRLPDRDHLGRIHARRRSFAARARHRLRARERTRDARWRRHRRSGRRHHRRRTQGEPNLFAIDAVSGARKPIAIAAPHGAIHNVAWTTAGDALIISAVDERSAGRYQLMRVDVCLRRATNLTDDYDDYTEPRSGRRIGRRDPDEVSVDALVDHTRLPCHAIDARPRHLRRPLRPDLGARPPHHLFIIRRRHGRSLDRERRRLRRAAADE